MNTTPLIIAIFVLMVVGVPVVVGAVRARWLEAGIYQRDLTNRVHAEIDLERWERDMGEAR